MRFEGVISKEYDIDWSAYWRDRDRFKHKIVGICDYRLETHGLFAEVHGRFGDDFCSGAGPLTIKEYDDRPVNVAEIQISKSLLKRLTKDGETRPEELVELSKLL